MRQTYTLTAKGMGRTSRRTFQADSDTDATYRAIQLVMDEAHDAPQGPWARGRIELRQGRRLVQEMEPKD